MAKLSRIRPTETKPRLKRTVKPKPAPEEAPAAPVEWVTAQPRSLQILAVAREVIALRKQQDDVAAHYKAATERLLQMMDEEQTKTVHTDHGNCTAVTSTQSVTDWGSIFEQLSDEQKKLVTVEKIDPKKFQSAMDLGMINPSLLLEHTEDKARAPYVRIDYKGA